MKKGNKTSKIGRPRDQRIAMVKSQVKDLIIHGYIRTTINRAKLVKAQFDKLADDAINKREKKLSSYLKRKEYIEKLNSYVNEDRKTGYTTLIKINNRKGDKAQRVLLEVIQ